MLRFGEYLVNSFPSVAFYVGQDHTPSWRDGAGHGCFLLGSHFASSLRVITPLSVVHLDLPPLSVAMIPLSIVHLGIYILSLEHRGL